MQALSKKEMYRQIRQKLADGISRAEVFKEFSAINSPKIVAMQIANVPLQSRVEEYLGLNLTLAGLILGAGLIRAGSVFYTLSGTGFTMFSLLAILLPAAFAYEVFRFKGYVYRCLGLLALLGVLRGIVDLGRYEMDGVLLFAFLLNLIVLSTAGGLSLYLAKRLVPDLKLLDARKNSSGQYEFTE